MRKESSFGEEMKRAATYGLGMNLTSWCDVCGKHKAGKHHARCSRIRQQRAINEKNMPKL